MSDKLARFVDETFEALGMGYGLEFCPAGWLSNKETKPSPLHGSDIRTAIILRYALPQLGQGGQTLGSDGI